MANTTNSPSLEDKTTVTTLEQESKVTKVLVAGAGAVGKTTLVRVLRDDKPLDCSFISQEYHRTPFIELETVKVDSIGGTGSKGIFLMVDVAGQLDLPIHALRDFSKLALGSVEMVLLVFSADNLQSLLDLKEWVALIKTQYKEVPGKNLQFVLIMNKSDLERNIDPSLISAFMDSEPLISGYFELSCKNGNGLGEVQACLLHLATSK
ncbi:MAG: Rab family GTPase [Candidatus Thorarchaeota archaeon]|jgi:small GTP-binding protein